MMIKGRLLKTGLAAALALSLAIPVTAAAANSGSGSCEKVESVFELTVGEEAAPGQTETADETPAAEGNTEQAPAQTEEKKDSDGKSFSCSDLFDIFGFAFDGMDDADKEELGKIGDRYLEIFAEAFSGGLKFNEKEIEQKLTPHEEELKQLAERAGEILKNSGWDVADDLGDLDFGDLAADYGDLTEDEIAELEKIYDRYDEILDEAIGDNWDISDEEYEQKLAPYKEELDQLEARAAELEKKAGWDDFDDWDGWDDLFDTDYGDLTEDESEIERFFNDLFDGSGLEDIDLDDLNLGDCFSGECGTA